MELFFLALILLLIAGGYYSFIVLPRQRAFKKQFKYVSAMQVGDKVVTIGGLIGTIKKIDTDKGLMTLEVAKDIELLVVAMAVSHKYDPASLADSARRASN